MKLIVGLGNPGKEYEKTRHNVGFFVTESFVEDNKWSKNDYAEYIKGDLDGNKFIFIKPTTFMNLSGNAVNYFMKYYKMAVEDILVIHDDLDLESGLFKLKLPIHRYFKSDKKNKRICSMRFYIWITRKKAIYYGIEIKW